MKNFKNIVRSFFGFSRAQTNGFVALIIVLSIIFFSEPLYHTWVSNRPLDFSNESNKLDSLTARWKAEPPGIAEAVKPVEKTMPVRLFEFNPNNVSKDELKALGFSDRLTKGMMNYRAKGGEFRIKTDLKKLYGMDSVFFKSLQPFIQLPEKIVVEKKAAEPKKSPARFNLNRADTTQFQTVYGVGAVLARRIIKYRDRLGGFMSNDQLYEVYGLDSIVVGQILKKSFLTGSDSLKKLNINRADEKLLSSHPYFSKKIARAIVTYRFQHGNYRSVDDLRSVNLLDEKTMTKIYPYLTVD
ncbi:MAG TPA: helix-hairpin-helix domain-containing protein [Cyclobacteriaceae bacterium]|nr:helix-hairpin-helix domain-containing protein [Cyclobacteriaceae bacterium]